MWVCGLREAESDGKNRVSWPVCSMTSSHPVGCVDNLNSEGLGVKLRAAGSLRWGARDVLGFLVLGEGVQVS